MYPSETVEEFKNRVENGIKKTTKHHNYFAQLQPTNRVSLRDNKRAEDLKKKQSAILWNLL